MAGFFEGKPGGFQRTNIYDPTRSSAFDTILQQALSGLGSTPANFEPIAQNEMARFRNDIIPSIAERFTGLGAQRSSGFQEALSSGAQDLSTRLAALGSQHNLASRGQLMQLLGMGLTPQEQITYQAEAPSSASLLGGPLLGGLGQGLGAALPALISMFQNKDEAVKPQGSTAATSTNGSKGAIARFLPYLIAMAKGGAGGAAAGGPAGAAIGAGTGLLSSLFSK